MFQLKWINRMLSSRNIFLPSVFLLLNHVAFSFNMYHETNLHPSRIFSVKENNLNSRKKFLSSTIAASLSILTLSTNPQKSVAGDDLFKPNPLTNRALEKLRILEQAEADNIKYGGELAPGSPKGKAQYAELLLPILNMQNDINDLDSLVHLPEGGGLEKANKILLQPQYEKLKFKKIFNAFADNIYYSDPDRSNLYLGGGAVPRNEQSIAYLLRNEILTNVENLQAEVPYLIKESKSGNPIETEDLYQYINICRDGMLKYIELVPPGELKMAQDIIASEK